ncbi:type I secretion system permease/ATPase [Aestuariirhabdus litorea]|uniref:Type I secretion system permease/ATPase n=1 Tax=Aestuariirhabdus litorea TaxID=2528527 RepID=A0A3P3VPY5_9GAMM|nr:type I secretion system permease/ATPase [Aestuariirhabdus litorea]RRJ84504.1 type I secretion system permease/ATPase [Aestuariirhabdus litorea]RWW97729.1 type I secretion system permease/ATPase [Endozoicomonadaceae bacterium GTF-13]
MDKDTFTQSGLPALVIGARLLGVAASVPQLQHRFPPAPESDELKQLVRIAKSVGLRARLHSTSTLQLLKLPMPLLARYKDGRFIVVVRREKGEVLVQDPAKTAPERLSVDVLDNLVSGDCILLQTAGGRGAGSRRFDIRWFIPALKKHRKLLTEVLLASVFIQLFSLVTPLFFQVIIDKVLAHKGYTTLDVLAFGLLVIALFEVALGTLRNYLFAHTSNRIDLILGARLFDHLIHLPIAYHQRRRTGETVARVRELDSLRQFLTGSALTLCVDLLFSLLFFLVLYLYSPLLCSIVAVSIPCYVALSALVTPLLKARLEEKFQLGAANQSFLVESVSGIETLKSMAVEPRMQRQWEDQLAAYVRADFRASQLGNLASQLAFGISKLVTVAILWVGAQQVIAGAMSVGMLVAFNMIAARINAPILRLVQLWQDFQQAGLSIERLGEILNIPTENRNSTRTSSAGVIQGRIRFEQVGFRYDPQRPAALRQLSFEIKAGEIVGIIGRSGSGKSTIARLLQRLYLLESGRIMVDEMDLAVADPDWLRQQVGVVLQDNFLFNRSIRDNIALADPGASLERVMQVAQLSGAHEFILQLPEGYDTEVGEQGCGLSGGQKQRIAIARALLKDPRILIFDEATSALDYESERVIQQQLRRIARNRTLIIIAHRLSTVAEANKILVMEQGHLVEQGAPAELLKLKGHYARMLALQAGGAGP